MNWETVWQFHTARFCVALEVTPELDDPADHFQFDEDIEAIRDGSLAWFCARVVVYLNGREVGSDVLGGCAYASVEDFRTSHIEHGGGDYFTDMMHEACKEARKFLRTMPEMRS